MQPLLAFYKYILVLNDEFKWQWLLIHILRQLEFCSHQKLNLFISRVITQLS